jgi:hypothetical protein
MPESEQWTLAMAYWSLKAKLEEEYREEQKRLNPKP